MVELKPLDRRDKSIMRLRSEGLQHREIADSLGLHPDRYRQLYDRAVRGRPNPAKILKDSPEWFYWYG